MSDLTDRFDCEAILDWKKCKQLSGLQAGYVDNRDETETVYWEVPYGAIRELREWVHANRQIDTNFDTTWRNYDGTWRVVKIEDKFIPNGNLSMFIVTISRGFYTALDWTSARLMAGDRVDQVATTESAVVTGDEIASTQIVKFPYVSPHAIKSISDALSAITYTDPVIGTQTLTGTWSVIVSNHKIEEDGTSSLYATIGHEKFVVKTYEDVGGEAEALVVRVFNCPNYQVQTIVDAWLSKYPLGTASSVESGSGGKSSIILRRYDAHDTSAWDDTVPRSDWREVDGLKDEQGRRRTGQSTPLADVATQDVASGTIIRTENKYDDRTGKWATIWRKLTCAPWCTGLGTIGGSVVLDAVDLVEGGWAPFEAYNDYPTTSYYCRFENLTKAQADLIRAALPAGYSNSWQAEKGIFGRWTGACSVKGNASKIGGSGWEPVSTTWIDYTWQTRNEDPAGGNLVRRMLTFNCGFIQSASLNSVRSFIQPQTSDGIGTIQGGYRASFKTLSRVGSWQA